MITRPRGSLEIALVTLPINTTRPAGLWTRQLLSQPHSGETATNMNKSRCGNNHHWETVTHANEPNASQR